MIHRMRWSPEGCAELRAAGRLVTRTTRDGHEILQIERGLACAIEKADDETYEVVASDESTDRYGDIIEVSGWQLDNYLRNPVWLADHAYWVEALVGQAVEPKIVGKELRARYKPDPINSSPLTDIVLAKLDSRSLRTVSVGFMPLEWERIRNEEGDWTGGFRYVSQELLEISWVVVPANPNALLASQSADLATPPAETSAREGAPPDEDMRELVRVTVGLWARQHSGIAATR